MTDLCDCCGTTDPRALVRAGVDRAHRALGVLDPAAVPVDERRPEHAMVFASAFASHLKYFTLEDLHDGDWRDFFDSAHSAQIAAAAIGDVDDYRTAVNERFRVLEDPDQSPSPADDARMATALRDVFDAIGTLAERLETLRGSLPPDDALRATITNLIRVQLGAMLQRLIGCYRAGQSLGLVDATVPPSADISVLGRAAASFSTLLADHPNWTEWPAAVGLETWVEYAGVDPADFEGLYGAAGGTTERINHLATHNLFRAAADAFLAALARVVEEAKAAVAASLRGGGHEPHYALFIAFLRLLEYGREAVNTFSRHHLDFYYRDVLRLAERPAEPGHAHAVVQLAKHVSQHLVAEGALIKAGKDETGADAFFRVDRDLVANEAAVEQVARLYRNPSPEPLASDRDRVYADVVEPDAASWHPFAEKQFQDGVLTSIAMAEGEIGFAIASHYLWMAEGARAVSVQFDVASGSSAVPPALHVRCLLTTEKGWLEARDVSLGKGDGLTLNIGITADEPAITPYAPAVHGYSFGTSMPVLLVLLRHDDTAWDYPELEDVAVRGIRLDVGADGLRTLALSNDHGPVDASKPFLVYGATPQAGSSFVIGSKEILQKATREVRVRTSFPVAPAAHEPDDGVEPVVNLQYLAGGEWRDLAGAPDEAVGAEEYVFDEGDLPDPVVDVPDLTPDAPYSTASRTGFVRLRLSDGFGSDTYPIALAQWVADGAEGDPPAAPVLPLADALSVRYEARQDLVLDAPSEARGRFFHVTPFGHLEQKASTGGSVPLVPQFRTGTEASQGELYLGLRALRPPQDVSLLFQVVDGTADPLTVKPDDHVVWSYLRGGEWVSLPADAVADATEGLLASGIARVSMPVDATTEHTLMPSGLHWLRLSVASSADAVCRLVAVRAQALRATSAIEPGAASTRGTGELPPGTLTKLDRPDAAVKSIEQPYPTFGGRPRESSEAFRTRVSERLRHKDRAIAMWDYEHLILEEFPSIFQARCLNHTRYEPSTGGTGVYRELAPGHVTIVTIPDLAFPDQRDPLRPYTSLRVLNEVEHFLTMRMNCFARLHVRNPQFEEVRVDLRVRLRSGFDETFHLERLRREITEFLSPWAFRSQARPSFNGRIRKSVLIDFIEERPYVDYLTDVHLFHRVPGQSGDGPDLEDVTGSRAISILVSTPAHQHDLRPIHDHDPVTAPAGCGCSKAVMA